MKPFIGALMMLAFTATAAAAGSPAQSEAVAQISAQLVRAPVLRASFRQERKMQALSRPLVTLGRVVAVAGRGVLWQVTEPQAVSVLMSADGIVEWDDAGVPRQTALGASAIFRALAGVLVGALTGDAGGLAELFEPTPVQVPQGWRLVLRPKDQTLAQAIATIEIAGGRFVEEAVITEAGGDETVIRFGEFRLEPAVLDATEQAYFER
jgi:hypothetical protein